MEDPVGLKVSRRLCVVAAMVASLGAASASAAVWRDVSPASVGAPAPERVLVGKHHVVEMNLAGLAAALGSAPLERTAAARQGGVVVELPWPDGGTRRFAMEKSPVMEAPLAARHPEIETYRGRGLDDTSAMGRFDLGPSGFHGMVLSNEGTVFIDPWSRSDTAHAVAYYKRDYRRNEGTGFHCDFDSGNPELVDPSVASELSAPPQGATLHGDFLKTYRLALAANVEYSTFHGGTIPLVHNAIVVAVNRVNTVYERDLAVHLNLVANNDLLIWLAEPDPYTNNNGGQMLGQNQASIDAIIGSANYDVGHVFSTGGGGVAGLGVVCGGGKARGVTGLSNPIGDGFYIDYVAHEMGHQFRGDHSFNGTTSNCGGGNRNASTAWEPGSGSTVMAYAGICGAEDLQPHSDDLFHVGNLIVEMQPFVTTGAGSVCAASTATGNPAPTVNGGADITVPANTPFSLTASATDPNSPTLSYVWEEMDLGTAAPPNTDDGSRPIFRTFNVLSSPTRTFPKLADILSGAATPAFGEAYPTTNRTLNFRVTVRDNFAGGGATSTDLVQVTVVAAAGPFTITAPNTAVSWTGGGTEAVTWNVAGTTGAPINAANVRISLSTDGGTTFPVVLAASTPNDGAENVVVPNLPTTTGRVKVEAVGNGFFDINNANLTIVGGTGPGASIADVSVTEGNSGTTDALFPVTLTAVSGVPVTVDYTTAPGTATAPSDYAITAGTLTFAPGETTHNVTVAVVGDTNIEPDETFFVNLSNLSGGGSIGDAQGQATIVNDDFGPVTINAGDGSVVEGDTTNPDLLVPVTLSGPSAGVVTVAYATADGTATAGTDYTAATGTLTFAPGVTSQNVTVSVISDLLDEANETFFVNLSAPTGGTIGDAQGVGTIVDDDGASPSGAELAHGSRLVRTLDTPDTYAIAQRAFSSYEVVVDEASGDLVPVGLDRVAVDGTTVIQTSVPAGTGQARSLRWENSSSTDVVDQTVRVSSGGCTTNCGADDTYRVRAYETTLAIPRFNNSGTQVTVLLLQNPTDGPISGHIYFWDAAGTQVASQAFTLAAKNLLVLNTATIPAANGVSGSLSVSHDGRYGELAAKSVALEPATGFSFDSPAVVRAR
jgi:reprolysin-like metallo-peptidase family M12B/Calx-beta domain-containing protein